MHRRTDYLPAFGDMSSGVVPMLVHASCAGLPSFWLYRSKTFNGVYLAAAQMTPAVCRCDVLPRPNRTNRFNDGRRPSTAGTGPL